MAKIKRVSFTLAQFCRRNSISRSTFYVLLAAGEAPAYFKVGRTIRITRRAENEWLEKMHANVALQAERQQRNRKKI